MSNDYDWFLGNLSRVKNLMLIYAANKNTPKRPTIKESDILRAAVVFLHSAFEDYYRATITNLLVKSSNNEALKEISLLGSKHKRAGNFTLLDLCPHRSMTVDDFIGSSIKQHMKKVSFNDYTDIAYWAKVVGIDLSTISEQSIIIAMVKRRHQIVHELDSNKNLGRGNHRSCPIGLQVVESWYEATENLVKVIDAEYERQIIAPSVPAQPGRPSSPCPPAQAD